MKMGYCPSPPLLFSLQDLLNQMTRHRFSEPSEKPRSYKVHSVMSFLGQSLIKVRIAWQENPERCSRLMLDPFASNNLQFGTGFFHKKGGEVYGSVPRRRLRSSRRWSFL